MNRPSFKQRALVALILFASGGSYTSGQAVNSSPERQSEEKPAGPVAKPVVETTEKVFNLDEFMIEETRNRGYNVEGTRMARQVSAQIVDALGPTDIQSLPSQNLDDILKRLPGFQVSYDEGEAQGVTVRGSNFIQTTINGREVSTAGARTLNLGDIPGDLVHRVDIYKTQSANQIEGGVGALINVQTKQPFDFEERFPGSIVFTGSLDEKARKWEPNGTIVLGRNWETSIGRIGISGGYNAQNLSIESDFTLFNRYHPRSNIFDADGDGVFPDDPDDAAVVTDGIGPMDAQTKHERRLWTGSLQWAPTDELELRASYLQTSYFDDLSLDWLWYDTPATNIPANASKFSFFPGTNILQSGTFANAAVRPETIIAPWKREVKHVNLGATWKGEKLRIEVGGDYTDSTSDQHVGILDLRGTVPSYSFELGGDPSEATISTSGINLLDSANFNLLNYIDINPSQVSYAYSGMGDLEYKLEKGGIEAIQVGVRWAERVAESNQAFAFDALSGPVTGVSGPALAVPAFDGNWLVPDPVQLRQTVEIRGRLGIGPNPVNTPNNYFELTEETKAVYARILYEFGEGGRINGDFGVRYVRTDTTGEAFGQVDGTTYIPIKDEASYNNTLPMGNIRVWATQKLAIRFGAGQMVGRPGFGDLNPALSINTDTGQAFGGNPALEAYTGDILDLSLEWYLSDTSYTTMAVYRQSYDGFIQRRFEDEIIGGMPTSVSRPYNAGTGKVEGFEIMYNQKFTNLPGRWAGLGFDVNYSYATSEQEDPATGNRLSFPGISDHTSSLNLFYDLDPLLARVGIVYRTEFINEINSGDAINAPIYFGDQLFVDASLQYRIGKFFLLVNCMNATQPTVGYYERVPDYPQNTYRTYRRWQFGARYNF